MKFTLAFLAVSVCLFGLIEALPNGGPLTIAWRQNCPFTGDCEAFAKQQLEDNGFCKSYTFVENWIEWRSCDVLLCPGNRVGKEDPTKSFPDCCPKCE